MRKQSWNISSLEGWEDIASVVASSLKPGDILTLEGLLGAGKTTFVQYLAKELGAKALPKSPTFALMRVYKIPKGRILHIDAYRIEDEKDLIPLDLDEELDEPGTILILEWPEHAKHWLTKKAPKRLLIEITPKGRKVSFNP